MFDASFPELVLVFVIALLILGPQRLPKVASQIGRWVGRARRTASQLRHQLEREIALGEIAEKQKRRAAATPQKPQTTQTPPPLGSAADPAPASTETRDSDEPRNEPPTPG